MSSAQPSSTRSYLDFQGLSNLRGDAARAPEKAARAAAEQFEAYFIQQMMKAMRETIEKSDMVDQGSMDMYQDLMDKEVSLQMVRRGGMGLADMLEKQLLQQQALAQAQPQGPLPLSTQEALQRRAVPAEAMLPLQPPRAAMPLPPAAAPAMTLERPGPMALPPRPGARP